MTPIAEGLFELDPDGMLTLLGGYSPSSGKYHFPRLDTCPYTGARDVEPVALSRDATLWAWTAVTAAPPGYEGPVPYGFGIVELTKEHLRVITRLQCADVDALQFGQPMTLVADELPSGETTWAFA
ncbi:MAG TPA: OB-fold domain-containing protein [Acidimicrobiia bacterium]|jgi:uncharacterized OB-fold protein|nr:OB-fold domain-containing protein [Acidimicrobiia bacterium]